MNELDHLAREHVGIMRVMVLAAVMGACMWGYAGYLLWNYHGDVDEAVGAYDRSVE
jgi:hypothetical protein